MVPASSESLFDVLVIGGGPAGFAAAVASARLGAATALIERHDVLGGMGTAALVNNFCPAHLDGKRLIIGGIFAELRRRLIERKAIFASLDHRYEMEAYNPAVFAGETAAMAREAGVELFLGAAIAESATPAEGPARITLSDGRVLLGRTVVDATGDAAVAAAAGVPFAFGEPGSGKVMPLTLCYKLGPIDLVALRAAHPKSVRDDPTTGQPQVVLGGFADEVAEARRKGELSIPRDDVACVLGVPGEPENATVNFGRVFVDDPTDPAQLAQAMRLARAQVDEGIRFFQKYVPGFAKVKLLELPRQIGVRESRRIEGLYTLTGEDVRACRQFEDAIAQCCYAIDIHGPGGSDATQLEEIPRGSHYDIPWRSLIPKAGPQNIVVAGRCISADVEAMSSFRVSPSMMAVGEAAGVTAALAARNGAKVAAVGPERVREVLRATGGILE